MDNALSVKKGILLLMVNVSSLVEKLKLSTIAGHLKIRNA